MTVGENTYKGLGVPLAGEAEMRQETSLDVLTITHSTLVGGDFLVLRSNVPAGSTRTGTEVLAITSAGYLLPQFKNVVDVTTGANFTILEAQSGTIFNLAAQSAGTAMFAILPDLPRRGTFYDFTVSSQADLGDFTITSSNSGARILLSGLTSAVSTAVAITPLSTAPAKIRLVAVSSILWETFPMVGAISSADTTNLTANDQRRGMWGLGAVIA